MRLVLIKSIKNMLAIFDSSRAASKCAWQAPKGSHILGLTCLSKSTFLHCTLTPSKMPDRLRLTGGRELQNAT
jgi:hypothetical protein